MIRGRPAHPSPSAPLRRAAGLCAFAAGLVLLVACGEDANERAAPAPAGPGRAPPAVPAALPAGATSNRFRSVAECGACHKAIYEEWKASWHGKAMSDPLFLSKSDGLQQEECIRCHAPVPLREMENWDVPIARADRREDAVSCLTCHQRGDRVAGPLGLSGPCAPIRDDDQRDAQKICYACHNQHKTGDEWLAGPYAPDAPEPRKAPAMTCLDCHMPWVDRPLVEGGPVRRGRAHTWPGGHSMDQLKKAGRVDVVCTPVDGGTEIRTFLTNVGAGHNIPTDARHRSFDVYVKVFDGDGRLLLDPLDPDPARRAKTQTLKARLNYRNSNKPDTQVAPLQRVSKYGDWPGAVVVPATKGRGEAWLVYRLTPDDELVPESLSNPDPVPFRARRVSVVEFTFGS